MQSYFDRQKNAKAGGYTFMILGALFLLLVLVQWRLPAQEASLLNEGIEVNLGNSDTGEGEEPPMLPGEAAPEMAEAAPSVPAANALPNLPLSTDNDDNDDPEAVAVPKKTLDQQPKPRPTPANTTAQAKPKPEPPAPPQPKAKATMGTYVGAKGPGGNNQDAFNNVKNQGVAGGKGDQGKPSGNITSDNYTGNGGTGNSGVAIARGLSGRRITKFPSFEDDFNDNAKIAVDIRVDEAGAVVGAVYQSRGSNSSNGTLKAIAIKKALQLKFNAGESESIGTVVFDFKLKN
jgi:outer membrane biosynthesis protein TonB